MNKHVRISDFETERMAVIKCKGSFKKINFIYKKIEEWIKNHDFQIDGDYYFRYNPENKDLSSHNILSEFGIPIKTQKNDKNFVKIAEIPEREIISALYKGPYINLPSIHGVLEDYARKHDLAPYDSPTEIYLNNPFVTKSSELLTEVQFTVIPFKPDNIGYVPLFSKIERKTIKKHKMAIMEHYGFVEDVYKARIDLIKWAEKRNIKVDAIHFKHFFNPEGISPRGLVFKVGVPVDDDFKEDHMIKIEKIHDHEVLSAIYKGPYVNIPNVTRMMVDYAFENNLEIIDFAEEVYLNSIFDVSCDELLTEVRMDVIDFNFNKNIKLKKEIERKTDKKHEIASIRQRGSFEKINKIKTDLLNWVKKNNVKTSGPHFLKFLNHPRSLIPEDISYEIGIPLDSTVEYVIKAIDFPRHKGLYLTHNGPISTLKDTHDFLKSYAKENDFLPLDFLVNVFVDEVPQNLEDETLIKVRLPVKKV